MRHFGLLVTMLLLACAPAWGASIDLFSTSDFSSCNLATPTGYGTFYVVAVDADESICCGPGLAYVAFSLRGLPTGWTTIVTPTPEANTVIGNPFGTGAIVAFPTWQFGHYILLYTITIVPASYLASATLTVGATNQPLPWSNIYCPYRGTNSDCPCDPNAACVDGGLLYINEPGECTVGVAPATWSQVKELYH
jgi:hypothetical protein